VAMYVSDGDPAIFSERPHGGLDVRSYVGAQHQLIVRREHERSA